MRPHVQLQGGVDPVGLAMILCVSALFYFCLQLAVEAVFLEAASQLIGPTTSGISERQAELLEQTAFDWVLSVENSRYVELMEPRRKVRPEGRLKASQAAP